MNLRKNQLILGLLNLVFFLAGLAIFFNFGIKPFFLNIHPVVDLVVLTGGVFILSVLYSGLLTPVVFLYVGIVDSALLLTNPIGVVLSCIPLLFASYAGSITGSFAKEDLDERKNLFEQKKKILLVFGLSLLLAIIFGLVFDFLLGVNQQALLNFS